MLRISSLKMRGFKSFKKADLLFPEDFSCLAGPNGSGKSNVCDAIRFVTGEQRLKALRAKKVKDLICHNSKVADVLMTLVDKEGKKTELRRAIREDGKISYRLNGKKATRGTIVETLKKYSLDETGRNIIAQGEVQRIIEMNGRQRREIIDGVAGISEFEAKKKEAMHELETVENRMREANLVLGEREAFLHELEREKGRAESYVSARGMHQRAKATLIHSELSASESRVNRLAAQMESANSRLTELQGQLDAIDEEIRRGEAEKGKIAEQLAKKEKRDTLFREMEGFKSELGSAAQALEDSKEMEKRLRSEMSSIDSEMESENKALEGIGKDAAELQKLIAPLEKKRVKYEEGREAAAVRSAISSLERELSRVREESLRCEGEQNRTSALIGEKKRMLESLSSGEDAEGGSAASAPDLIQKKQQVSREIDALFRREKELNEESASLDRTLLDLREKVAILRAQSSPGAMNPAVKFIQGLKDSGEMEGVHGPLVELIEFDPKYAEAVDAAGGARLLYVVVDSSDVAMKVIKRLKASNAGRATFIPLQELNFAKPPAGRLSPLSDSVRYSAQYKKAVDYVFGSTFLVKDYAEAKKAGLGSARMVTLGGELFERSAIVTGGKKRGGVAVAAQLTKMESQLEDAKQRRNGIFADLRNVREEMSSLRREKADCEVEIKKAELVEESARQRAEAEKKRRAAEKEAAAAIEELEKSLSVLAGKRAAFAKEEGRISSAIAEKNEELQSAEKKHEERMRKVEREQEELTQQYSELRGKLDSLEKEKEMRLRGIASREEKKKQLNSELSEVRKKSRSLDSRCKELQQQMGEVEKRIGESSKTLEKLLMKSKEHESFLQEKGRARGEVLTQAQKSEKQLHQLEVEQASISTRLTDLKAEMESFGEVELLEEKGKERLTEMMRSSEQQLSELGDVNLAAPEQYEKRKAEISEVRERIERLRVERNAVMEMISSIEEKKKEAFTETFDSVNDNFKKLFEYISIGEGYLYLDKPADIFNSGLYIKLKRSGRESPLDALSGGEKTLLALMFSFALQFHKPSPFYILDEVDASLDKANSKNLANLLRQLSGQSQFIVVSHDDTVVGMASAVLGVTRIDGNSQVVGVKLPSTNN